MKITNLELTGSFIPALQELAAIKTPSKVAYAVVKTFKAATAAVDEFEGARKNIIETRCVYGEDKKPVTQLVPVFDKTGAQAKDPQGNPMTRNDYTFDTPETKAEVVKLIEDLTNQEIELNIFSVKLEEFGSTEITAALIFALKDVIVEN